MVAGIQYWSSDYFFDVLGTDKAVITTWFAFTSITAPIFGAVLGGQVMKLVGGIQTKYALPLCLFIGCLACISGLPVPYIDNFYIAILLIWLLLFFGGMILPNLTAIMLDSVEIKLKTRANSIANLSYNLLGYFPAPQLSGRRCDFLY